jgi:choline dehydrogenase-like flavoprotein
MRRRQRPRRRDRCHALAKADLKVALLENGSSLPRRHRLRPACHALGSRRASTTGEFAFNTAFGRRERNHFTPVGDRPEHGWLKAVGGRSLCWAGHSLRFGPGDFRQWPIAYDEVEPYYSRAEKYMGVYGNEDGLWNLPDGEFTKPIGMRCGEWLLRRGVERPKAKGAKMELVQQRKAMLTGDHPSGRALCHYCGKCNGCCVDAKYTSANTPIPQGRRTGNLTLVSEAMVTRIVMDGSGRRVAGVEIHQAFGAVERVDCRALVLACNSIETPRQLLLNKSRQFPDGLANSSGQIGRNLTNHFGLSVTGFFPELRHRKHMNDESAGTYQSLLTGLYWDKPNPKFEGTYRVQNTAGWSMFDLPVRNVKAGRGFKRELREKCAAARPYEHAGHHFDIARKVRGPRPRQEGSLRPECLAHPFALRGQRRRHGAGHDGKLRRDHPRGRGEVISTPGKVTTAKLEIDFNHWVGTVRMGNDPKTSVLDRFGRSHGYPTSSSATRPFSGISGEESHADEHRAFWRMSDHLSGTGARRVVS